MLALSTTSGRLTDKARKDLIGMFENFGLNITAQANLKSVNFLDITLDLSNGTPNHTRSRMMTHFISTVYPTTHLPSYDNYPQASSINKRINKLSCDEETFDAASSLYNDALKQSNFNTNLTYEPAQRNTNNRNNSQTQNR